MNDPAEYSHPYAAPIHAPDLSGLPPAHIITAEYDPLRDEGAAFADRLRDAGVNVQYSCYPGMVHMFISMFALLDKGRAGLDEVVARLKAKLGRGDQSPAGVKPY